LKLFMFSRIDLLFVSGIFVAGSPPASQYTSR
jgi:hypothetical protein